MQAGTRAAAAASPAPPPLPLPCEALSSRCVSLEGHRCRGARAPEMIARAEAKRRYVARTPYLVTGCVTRCPLPLPPVRARTPPLDGAGSAALLLPGRCSATGGAGGGAARLPSTSAALLPGRCSATGAAGGAAGGGDARLPSTGAALRRGRVDAAAEGAAPPTGTASVATPALPLSLGDRFHRMRRTLRLRLTVGKSAIHGLGAIAKAHHAAGEHGSLPSTLLPPYPCRLPSSPLPCPSPATQIKHLPFRPGPPAGWSIHQLL
eukprot:366439-Chlamydomonas_euryale.AAC.1